MSKIMRAVYSDFTDVMGSNLMLKYHADGNTEQNLLNFLKKKKLDVIFFTS